MISCDKAKNLLSDYLDKKLSKELSDQINEHLAQCSECRQVFADVDLLTSRLGMTATLTASAQFDQNLRSHIVNNSKESKPLLSIRGFSYGFSGAVVLAGMTFIIVNTFSSSTAPTQAISPSVANIHPQQPVSARTIQKSASNQIKAGQIAAIKDSLKNKPFPADPNKIKLTGQER